MATFAFSHSSGTDTHKVSCRGQTGVPVLLYLSIRCYHWNADCFFSCDWLCWRSTELSPLAPWDCRHQSYMLSTMFLTSQTLLQMLRPDQTRPDQTRPDQPRPDQTRPDQTRSAQTRPALYASTQSCSHNTQNYLQCSCWHCTFLVAMVHVVITKTQSDAVVPFCWLYMNVLGAASHKGDNSQ